MYSFNIRYTKDNIVILQINKKNFENIESCKSKINECLKEIDKVISCVIFRHTSKNNKVVHEVL